MRVIIKLSAKESFELIKYTQEFYAARALGDIEFAEEANAHFQWEKKINHWHVRTAREVLNIPSSAQVKKSVHPDVVVTELTKRVAKLEARLESLIAELGAKL